MKPTVLTTYLAIIPIVTALYFGFYIYALLILMSLGSSVKYHRSLEREWKKNDNFFATVLFFYNIYLLFLLRLNLEFAIPIVVITILAFLFLYIEKRNYEFIHSIWHILVIGATFLCALGFGLL